MKESMTMTNLQESDLRTDCDNCKYYSQEDGYCTAMICTPISCDELLPCECGETDPLTLYERGMNEKIFDGFTDDDFDDPFDPDFM